MRMSSNLIVRAAWLVCAIVLGLSAGPGAAEEKAPGLSLEECLTLALENHPTLRGAKGTTRAAEAALEQVKVNNRVTVGAAGGVDYDGDYEEWDDRYHSESARITASKLLYDTGRNRLQKEMQSETLKGTRENERGTRVSVAANAKRAYYDLVLKFLNRDVEQEKLNNLEEHLKTARGLYEVGNSPFIDVTTAEADVASARTSLLKAESDILVYQEALRVAMGMEGGAGGRLPPDVNAEAGGPITLALSTKLLLPGAEPELENLLDTALEDRPDYRQALHTVRARELGITNAARTSAPTITGQLASSFSNREASSSSENYSVGITLNIPIVDGGAQAAAVEAARAQWDQAAAERDRLRQQVAYGVRSAALSLTSAVDRARASETSVRYAEENLELARGRYEVGVGDPLELSDAVSSLANARFTYYQALYDAQTARANLDEAMGHLPPELTTESQTAKREGMDDGRH
ncbi:MAG: TolC family protein [Fretibacterium sp.]|nr:TolC family protein [Fretibacterium sp.]